MSSDDSENIEEKVEVVLEAVEIESSEEPPMEEWSSLVIDLPEENKKRLLYSQGLYSPGSGEVCAKYISMSQSSVLRHPYFNYPAVLDPGILKALLKPEQLVIYPDDGQELYLAICKEMNQCPVRMFYKGLVSDKIDLSYYGVNPNGVRAMAMALRFNKSVEVFNLTDNFLSDDACFHLGEMLVTNTVLSELNLSGCRIGSEGARRLFANLSLNMSLVTLNLNKNQICDAGMEHITKSVAHRLDVKKLYLSYNNISGRSLIDLTESLEIHNKFLSIDLSWNKLFGVGTNTFLNAMSESSIIQDINLAWNSLCGSRISLAIKNLLKAPQLKSLDLSNNKLAGEDIQNIVSTLAKAKKLTTLNLSYNPLSPADALKVINKVKMNAVKVQNVLLENVNVDEEFLLVLKHMHGQKSKKNTTVTYGGIISITKTIGPDPRELVLNRSDFLAKKPKKQPVDVALIVLQLEKNGVVKMDAKEFLEFMQKEAPPLDNSLLDEFSNVFPGPKSAKAKTIDIRALADYMRRKWPDRKLPPTPPPEPEPLPPPPPEPQGKGKGKGKGKK